MSRDTPQARLLAALVEYRAASAARSWIGVVDLMDHHQRREQRFCDAVNELLAAALVPTEELAALNQQEPKHDELVPDVSALRDAGSASQAADRADVAREHHGDDHVANSRHGLSTR